MFVIAHLSGRIPSYFWKKDSSGVPLISVDLTKAVKFNTRKDAKEMLSSFPTDDVFDFQVYEIGIYNEDIN